MQNNLAFQMNAYKNIAVLLPKSISVAYQGRVSLYTEWPSSGKIKGMPCVTADFTKSHTNL